MAFANANKPRQIFCKNMAILPSLEDVAFSFFCSAINPATTFTRFCAKMYSNSQYGDKFKVHIMGSKNSSPSLSHVASMTAPNRLVCVRLATTPSTKSNSRPAPNTNIPEMCDILKAPQIVIERPIMLIKFARLKISLAATLIQTMISDRIP